MKNAWITGGLVLFIYLIGLSVGTYYFAIYPYQQEKPSVYVAAKAINAKPVTDELAKTLKERQKYGNWPINIETGRLGKNNPFRQ